MSFIVKKNIKGKDYFYLRESKREGDKVRAVTVAYLGKTRKEAEGKAKEFKSKEEVKKTTTSKEKGDRNNKLVHIDLNVEGLAGFCKKKGFVYQDSEIYGSLAGFWDFGPLGVELKNNIKQHWWKTFVHQRDDVVGIDGSIITHKKIWEASGHVSSFTDVMLECEKCKNRFRADFLIEDKLNISTDGMSVEEINKTIQKEKIDCPKCKSKLGLGRKFNLMFKTYVGPLEKEDSIAYLRPETAQLIFADFKLVHDNARMKLPFGIAQVGKAFRNEISPRDFLFRSREFEQMEIEYFVHPDKINNCPLLK